ncbi:MAG: aspartate--tRNA ligase [Candidatus Wolfebacteria bacterium]|nr:aspartate--tRNA ligase [Candidatus Wolfebacteria bacterium]
MRTLVKEILNKEGEIIELMGWVAVRRDHGKIIFIDLRDRSGLAQLVFVPSNKEVYELANKLRSEWVIKVSGKIAKRPKGMENPEMETGLLEVQVESLEILNEAENLPIDVYSDGRDIGEDVRMKYRYLDLRRPRLNSNLKNRAKIINFFRDFLVKKDFVEIETPVISKSTPEGARDYLVPSRLQPGKFYALPQSPQQYKQLLMVSAFERYFQVAKCFRDEDSRGDRQPEFTQLDLEMSFVKREDVMEVIESMLIETVKNLYPDKKVQQIPFPRFSYKEAVDNYGTDRPDLRKDKNDPNELAFCWVVDFPFFERVVDNNEARPELVEGSHSGPTGWTFTHNPFSAPIPEHMDDLMNKKNIGDILTTQYDVVLNGFEIGGGSIRNHKSEALEKVFEILGYPIEKIQANFGHMLEAFKYGAPPHGGIALGLDRIFAILFNEPNIREVMAFPKTGDGRDLMMQAPSVVDKQQLDELGIKIKNKEQLINKEQSRS